MLKKDERGRANKALYLMKEKFILGKVWRTCPSQNEQFFSEKVLRSVKRAYFRKRF
ncbi:hypothetical protein HMPREF3187_01392 [Aerococcus christensenii]|uniref:Uncharacterized protein n=1 Tax=Aerococcus christensenii TaxID=87541 RepID=A0A133XU72_9LACT|nr:hypothetical protein HMPREF3187_01392 [Aerococcus christensenii]